MCNELAEVSELEVTNIKLNFSKQRFISILMFSSYIILKNDVAPPTDRGNQKYNLIFCFERENYRHLIIYTMQDIHVYVVLLISTQRMKT